MSNATLNKTSLERYLIVSEPGTYVVKVANAVKPEYLIEDGSKSRYIVNLRCAPIEKLEECLSIFGKDQQVYFDEVKHCFSSGAIWDNELTDINLLPAKGEEVIATFEEKEDLGLVCVSLTLLPRKKLNNFSLLAYERSRQLLQTLI